MMEHFEKIVNSFQQLTILGIVLFQMSLTLYVPTPQNGQTHSNN